MRIIKSRKGDYKSYGFTNNYIAYGKNAKGDYRLEFSFYNYFTIPLYWSKKKPAFRNIYIITALVVPFFPALFIGCQTLIFLLNYIEGAKNFFTDSSWITNVRFFNWVNIAIILILTIFMFLT